MIQWHNVTEKTPPIDQQDEWNKENKISPRLLAAFISQQTHSSHIAFATFNHVYKKWHYEGFTGNDYVTLAWSELNNPDQIPFQDWFKDAVKQSQKAVDSTPLEFPPDSD